MRSAQVIAWQDAAAHISQLMDSGAYASNVELAEAGQHERMQLAQALWYLKHDLSDEAREQGYLSCMDTLRGGGFPDETARLAEQLTNTDFRETLSGEFAQFYAAHEQDRSLLRFHYHKLENIWQSLRDLSLPRREYSSEMTAVPELARFITEDEIDHALDRGSGVEGGKGRIYEYFTADHTSKEKAAFLKDEYGIGGHSHAVSGASHSDESHDSRGIVLKKAGCANVELSWTKVAARIDSLIQKDRFLSPREKERYAQLQREKEAERELLTQAQIDYNSIKEAHPDDIVLFQVGDFFEIYGEDAKQAAELLDLNLTTRAIPGAGRVEMCGVPSHNLEMYVERLRDKYDVTIAEAPDFRGERHIYTLRSIDHEAEAAINAYEAEFGADGTRVFRDPAADVPQPTVQDRLEHYRPVVMAAVSEDTAYRNACGHSDRENAEIECNAAVRRAVLNSKDMELIRLFSDVPEFRNHLHQEVFEGTYERFHDLLRPLSQDDIDDALRAWNGNIESKHAVVRYMQQHGREKETAAWLAHEYGGKECNNLFIVRAGSPETAELTWSKVQRRIAQLIREDKFFTEQEKSVLEQNRNYLILDRLRADCEYFLGAGNRAEKHLWAGSVYAQIVKMRELYDALPQKPEWLTKEMIDDYADRMAPQYQVVVYHHFENGFDEKRDYQTLEEAEKAAQGYVDGTMGSDGFAYDGAAIYDQHIQNIGGKYEAAELPDLGENKTIQDTIPADPNVKNYSYAVVDGEVYYRENSVMVKPSLNATAKERVKGMAELRDCVHRLIDLQMWESDDISIRTEQQKLNRLYDRFTEKYGLINSRGNALAFADDSSYYLLCSLEMLDDEDKTKLKGKADMFTKRTIRQRQSVTSVDTAAEALALSIGEKARVDMAYMSQLTGKSEDDIIDELNGVIFLDPVYGDWQTADEYLSGNVRQKLREAENAAVDSPGYLPNVEALRAAQPKDLDASEIEVRLGATWIDKKYIQQFMFELLEPPLYARRSLEVNYSEFTAEWNISSKNSIPYNDINARMTYGTDCANAYKILEDTLNLRDVRIYDTVRDADGKEKRVLNSKETTLAQQKQQAIKEAFRDWIWRDPDRRRELVQLYNERFNSTRPREYDGRHLIFPGMNPEITLREHQRGAIAHDLYGGNTLLAHEVGAGKTFEMIAAAMEGKRLGLCQKSLFAVPNHLTEQWASEFLRLYPSANILVAAKKDFETRNRKKFCARIATSDYDAVIIGHSQFERIPVSRERQERLLQEQIWEIEDGIAELKASRAERFTIKELERTKKNLETKLQKLHDADRKDDVVTFEQLGVDRLYVDEAHSFKNLFLYTKMRNVAGLSTTDAQKSSDILLKCRYIDEITHGKGVTFATGTPISNSMTELYTMMRYLQHDMLKRNSLTHFDCWASAFGETTTAIELAPEGTGYRARTRFAKFFNLPELMNLFREAADIKTADQLNLPTPTAVYHTEVTQPTALQQQMVQELSERAAKVHSGAVAPTEDNMLKITSDGRKLGLDQRVINPDLPDDPNSKVNLCVDNIHRIWQDGQAEKLTQLVFCDLSTPKGKAAQSGRIAAKGTDSPELHALEAAIDAETEPKEPPFTIYDDIREKLVARGIPREQISFIHEANTEVRKKELFAKVRSGQVRVLMGSTFKMGAGMNVQDRLVALHDLDCPWRPGDLEQRSGRIIRQGNRNKEVHIYRYVTESTFDAYLWQTVENKQKFISQIMTSKSPVRSYEDIDEAALSYAEIKALCAGDERIREKMDLDVDVARLRLMKANHQSQQYRLEDNILRHFPAQIEENKGFLSGFEADMKTLEQHPHPKDGFAGMEVKGDLLTDKDNAGAALLEAFKDAKGLEPVPIGTYRGFSMSLTVENFGKDFILTLKGKMSHRVELGKDARGNLVRIDNALAQMPERYKTVQGRLENVQAQLATAKAELKEKSARLAELNAELNIDDRTPMEQAAENVVAKRPSVLGKLKAPCVHGAGEKKKSHEQEAR